MKTCDCGSETWHYDNEFWCAKCGKKGPTHFFCVHCGAEFEEATGALLQKHIRECPEHPLPKALAECEKLRKERDRYHEIAKRAHEIEDDTEDVCFVCCEPRPSYPFVDGICELCQRHKNGIERLSAECNKMRTALEEAYELSIKLDEGLTERVGWESVLTELGLTLERALGAQKAKEEP